MPGSAIRYGCSIGCVLLLTAAFSAGCKDKEAPRSYYRDLGTSADPLPPPPSPIHNLAAKDGSADWHPFRELGASDAAEDERSADTGGPGAGVDSEIPLLIEEYNEYIGDKAFDELGDFFVAAQQDVLTQFISAVPQAADKLHAIASAIEGADAGLARQIGEVAALLSLPDLLRLQVDSLRTESKDRVVGLLPATHPAVGLVRMLDAGSAANEVHFVLQEDEDGDAIWYVDSPALRAVGPKLPALTQAVDQLEALAKTLAAGQAPSDAARGVLALFADWAQRATATGDGAGESKETDSAGKADQANDN